MFFNCGNPMRKKEIVEFNYESKAIAKWSQVENKPLSELKEFRREHSQGATEMLLKCKRAQVIFRGHETHPY